MFKCCTVAVFRTGLFSPPFRLRFPVCFRWKWCWNCYQILVTSAQHIHQLGTLEHMCSLYRVGRSSPRICVFGHQREDDLVMGFEDSASHDRLSKVVDPVRIGTPLQQAFRQLRMASISSKHQQGISCVHGDVSYSVAVRGNRVSA